MDDKALAVAIAGVLDRTDEMLQDQIFPRFNSGNAFWLPR